MSNAIATTTTANNPLPPHRSLQTAQVTFPTPQVPFPTAQVPVPTPQEPLNLSPSPDPSLDASAIPPTTSEFASQKTTSPLEPFHLTYDFQPCLLPSDRL